MSQMSKAKQCQENIKETVKTTPKTEEATRRDFVGIQGKEQGNQCIDPLVQVVAEDFLRKRYWL